MRYVVLIRGINVGGTSKVPMAQLRALLAERFGEVRTYIASGNVVLESPEPAAVVASLVDELLQDSFDVTALVRVLVIDEPSYRAIVEAAPPDFGAEPHTFRYDVLFYMGVEAADVAPHLVVNPEVEETVLGERAAYHRRITAQASRSRLGKLAGTPVYPSLTIRNWNTTRRLAEMLDD